MLLSTSILRIKIRAQVSIANFYEPNVCVRKIVCIKCTCAEYAQYFEIELVNICKGRFAWITTIGKSLDTSAINRYDT